jgi:hypothetical protein
MFIQILFDGLQVHVACLFVCNLWYHLQILEEIPQRYNLNGYSQNYHPMLKQNPKTSVGMYAILVPSLATPKTLIDCLNTPNVHLGLNFLNILDNSIIIGDMARYQGKQVFSPSDIPTQQTLGGGCGRCCLPSFLLIDLENDSNESQGDLSPLPSWVGWLPCCFFDDAP